MTLRAKIADGEGSGKDAGVTKDHLLKTGSVPISASDLTIEQLTRLKFFSSFFAEDGGSEDLDVDGSVTPVEFAVGRVEGQVLHIQSIRFVFNDEQMNMGGGEARRFASAAAAPGLTNGLEMFVEQAGTNQDIFNTPVKQMADFWNYNTDFLNAVGAFGAGEDFLSWDIALDQPIVLTEGSVDKLIVKISDDLTNINFLKVIARGWREAA